MALKTPVGTASYPALFTPRPPRNPKDAAKYQLTVMLTEDASKTEEFKNLQKAALQAAFDEWGDSQKTKDSIKSGGIKMPFIKGEKVPEGWAVVLRLNSKEPVGVVDRYRDPKTGKARVITDPGEVYPGSLVRASVGAYAYDVDGNKGVAFGLRNVQKVGDGPRIDGRSKAEDEFEGEDMEDAAMPGEEDKTPVDKADMSDLLG